MKILGDGRICHNCGVLLHNKDYFFRRKTPDSPGGYVCPDCGYCELEFEKKEL